MATKYSKPTDWTVASKHTDNLVSRVILFRTLMLQRSADVQIGDGSLWSAKPYQYWMDSLAVSRYQLTTALKDLRDRGLVETKVKKSYGKPVLHIRLGRLITKHQSKSDVRLSNEGSSDNQTKGCLTIGQTIKKEVLEGGSMEEKENFIFLTPPKASSGSDSPSEAVSDEDKLLKGAPTFTSLKKVWQIRWKRHQTGPVDGLPASGKVMAQWKQFVRKADTHDTNSLQLIALALSNWPDFRGRIKSATGKGSPAYPQIAVVMAHFPTLLAMAEPVDEVGFEYDEGQSPAELLAAHNETAEKKHVGD